MPDIKHKPATALPWIVNQRRHVCSANEFTDIAHAQGDTTQANIDNAAYIAHACNAYPKLVAALRWAIGGMEDFGPNDMRSQVVAALHEIGEDE